MTKQDWKRVAQVMKNCRLASGNSQSEWAKIMKTDQPTISRIEKGRQRPNVLQWEKAKLFSKAK